MHIVPTQEEVVRVLRETGALREGHFEYPSGLHSNEYLQVPIAMRSYQHQRMLTVGLSRLLRSHRGKIVGNRYASGNFSRPVRESR
jgi:orotate phosphoribosyltransferase